MTNTGASIGSAPPMKERPRCRACGKRLKPNYNTEYKDSADAKKKRVYREWGSSITEDDRGAQQDSRSSELFTSSVTW